MLQPAIDRAGRQGAQLTENAMRDRRWTRREVLKTSTAVAAGVLFAEPTRAAAPPPTGVTPALCQALQSVIDDGTAVLSRKWTSLDRVLFG